MEYTTPYEGVLCIEGGKVMLSWSITFFVIALIAAVLGFTGIAGAAVSIAKVLAIVFLVLFILSLITTIITGRHTTPPSAS